MSQNISLKDIQEQQRKIDQMVQLLIAQLTNLVQSELSKEIKPVNGNPKIAIVSYKTIAESPGLIMSPDYYLPQVQAEAISTKLKNCKGFDDICKTMSAILHDKKIQINKNTVLLNPKTMTVLETSELGQFVLNEYHQ